VHGELLGRIEAMADWRAVRHQMQMVKAVSHSFVKAKCLSGEFLAEEKHCL
jgi:hypothetical protein